MKRYLRTALTRSIVINAFRVAVVVGTILNLINQADAMLTLDFSALNIPKFFLNYLVPYLVATHGGTMALISRKNK